MGGPCGCPYNYPSAIRHTDGFPFSQVWIIKARPMKNRYIIYIPLALLFVIAAIYQARFIEGRIIYIQGKVDRVRPPVGTGRYNSTISYVAPEAEQSGIHKGDQLIAVDGRPYTGPGYIWDRVYDARPGDSITLTVRHQESEASSAEEIKQVELARGEPEPYDFWGLLYMLVLRYGSARLLSLARLRRDIAPPARPSGVAAARVDVELCPDHTGHRLHGVERLDARADGRLQDVLSIGLAAVDGPGRHLLFRKVEPGPALALVEMACHNSYTLLRHQEHHPRRRQHK